MRCALQGVRAFGMKPVASGCERIDGAVAQRRCACACSGRRPARAALRGHQSVRVALAARAGTGGARCGRRRCRWIRCSPPTRACARDAECVVVEGVGGWAAPLATGLMQADLVRASTCPWCWSSACGWVASTMRRSRCARSPRTAVASRAGSPPGSTRRWPASRTTSHCSQGSIPAPLLGRAAATHPAPDAARMARHIASSA